MSDLEQAVKGLESVMEERGLTASACHIQVIDTTGEVPVVLDVASHAPDMSADPTMTEHTQALIGAAS